ncbi:MAG: hypothetical protein ISR91_00005 [Candidatus Delongbacteria bacterium]|nr:hypothetical protein [Candidatus Delongbacteria bacterium]
MKTNKTMITTLMITFGLLAGTASAANLGDKVSLQQDRNAPKIMLSERNPLHVIPRAMMAPEQPFRSRWPEGNMHRLEHDTTPFENLM